MTGDAAVLAVASTVAAAVVVWPARRSAQDRVRLSLLRPGAGSPTPAAAAPAPGPPMRRRFLLAAAVALAGMWWWGLPVWVVPLLAGAGLWSARRRADAAATPDLPLVVDLFAACLRSGASVPRALAAAATAGSRATHDRVMAVARSLEAGVDPREAWAAWLADDHLAVVARTCLRASTSGAAAADDVARVAARLRARRRSDVQERTARAAVWVVLPLGLCFLPAFVLVGVVPVAVGLVAQLR